jgi:nucleotide-binding universal stress UspA family protein
MKILFATDDSAASRNCVAGLIAHLRSLGEAPQVHLLHVHLPIPVGAAAHQAGHDSVEAYYREESEQQLAPAKQALIDAGLEPVCHSKVGRPAEVIVETARALGCSLICMGTRGHGAISGAVLGSVAAKVVRLSDIPVFFPRSGS